MLSEVRSGLTFLVALLAAVLASGALAAAADKEQHKFNATDQAAAKGAVILKADLGTGWTGGTKTPDLTPPKPCSNWNPKQGDLVLTGAAETDWKHAGLELDTEAQVLQDTHMVALDWQRTVTDPHALTCLKLHLQQQLSSSKGVKFVSFGRMALPKIGTFSRAYLTTIDVTSGANTVRVAVEDILIGSKRTELTLTSTTAKASQAAVAAADVKLAKTLIARAKA
jgi:hypothetical protein